MTDPADSPGFVIFEPFSERTELSKVMRSLEIQPRKSLPLFPTEIGKSSQVMRFGENSPLCGWARTRSPDRSRLRPTPAILSSGTGRLSLLEAYPTEIPDAFDAWACAGIASKPLEFNAGRAYSDNPASPVYWLD